MGGYVEDCFDGGRSDFQFFGDSGPFQGNTETSTKMFIGIEIEKEFDEYNYDAEDCAGNVSQITDTFFANSGDGSLDNGIEFQSMPATFKYHKKLADEGYYDDVFSVMSDNGLVSATSAGSHVHISKAAISATTFRKMCELMYEKFSRRFVEAIARRSERTWAIRDRGRAEDIANGSDSDKYNALNNQRYCPTYEFRLWNSPESTNELMEQVEFVTAFVEYCKATDFDNLTQRGFRHYVRDNRALYPNLRRRIVNHFVVSTTQAERAVGAWA